MNQRKSNGKPRKQYVLKIYKNGKPVATIKSINVEYVVRKLKEQ